jgi:hypothetical protein
MRMLFKRWYVWLVLFLLLGLPASTLTIYFSRNRVTQESFESIREGMTLEEAEKVLGKVTEYYDSVTRIEGGERFPVEQGYWRDGPSLIILTFKEGKVLDKEAYLESAQEHVRWHVRQALAKIGIDQRLPPGSR